MKRCGFNLLICLVTVLLGACAAAAQTAALSGSVVDVETGEALPGASVAATATDFKTGTTASLKGKFAFSALPPGTYTVAVSYIGFREKTVEGLVLDAGANEVLDIALQPVEIPVNPVTITVSRRRERVIETPAAVNVIDRETIAARPTLVLMDHVQDVPGVNIHRMGLTAGRPSVRGFNTFFTGRLLTLTDNRIANLAGTRINWAQLIPAANEDIERIEVVSGPASALYGPNAAGGVLHVITKSPFEAPGTSASLGTGQRDLLLGSFRHAGTFNPRIGYKISGRYARGTNWKFVDPAEPDSIVKGVSTPAGRTEEGGKIANERDFDIEQLGGEARLDFRLRDDLEAIVAGGVSRASDIELSPVGAWQLKDWTSGYVQGRLIYGDLFAQSFFNWSDAGDTFQLRNGDFVIDNSTQFVAQVQHGLTLWDDRQRLTYGAETLLTHLDSEATIYGRNEDDNDIDEIGFYLQSETDLSAKVRLVGALRLDDNDRLQDRVLSPRAAVVYKPNKTHYFRLTYNRSFQTPPPTAFFVDFNVSPTLGPLPYAIQFRGIPPETGYHFVRDENGGVGGLYMQSPFMPPEAGGPAAYIPADATSMWGAIVGVMQLQGIDLSALPAPSAEQVGTVLQTLNIETQTFEATTPESVQDIPPLDPRKTSTLEIGYKSVIDNRILLTANAYYERNRNFLGLGVRTPNVLFDPVSLAAYLGNFMPEEEAAALAAGIAGIPVGTVAPREGDPTDIIATLIEEGDVSHYGAEFGLAFYKDENWVFSGDYTYLNKNFFKRGKDELDDLTLNGPKNKLGAGAHYRDAARGMAAKVGLRYVGSYRIISGGLGRETIKSHTTVDLNVRYALPFDPNLGLSLSVQNILDDRHRDFLAVPETGRLGILRLTYSM